MTGGTPFNRFGIVVLHNGTPVIDWGQGLFQDFVTGEFIHGSEADISHSILDNELEQLKINGEVIDYDATTVYLGYLPELPHSTIE